MNKEDSNLKCSVEQTITDAINQLHNIEGEDRYARLIEIIELFNCVTISFKL